LPKTIKKERLIALFFFELLMIFLWGISYLFLSTYDFSKEAFWFTMIVMAIATLGLGHIFISYLLEAKYEMQKNLIHITDEILHELNIPLSTIDANTKLLSKSTTDEKKEVRLIRISHATIRLKRLYEKLSYALTNEITPAKKEEFILQDIIRACSEMFIMQNRNEIVYELPEVPVLIFADKIGFEQTFENILSNAMKYSTHNTPIDIKFQNNKLEIIDQGIGISSSDLLQIHERYYQGDSSKDGRGIGIAVVKSYCDKENIGLSFYSNLNVGTRVVLDISKIIARPNT
jgi:signal transduction histidine kinase